MRGLSSILTSVFMLIAVFAFAQPSDDLISADAGKCYAKCLIQDQYETVTEQVLTRAASQRVEVVPAVYETITEQVLAKTLAPGLRAVCADGGTTGGNASGSGSARGGNNTMVTTSRDADGDVVTTTSCRPETISEQVLSKEAYTTITTSPARFEDVSEQVLVKEAYTTLKVVPATFETVTEQVLTKEASTSIQRKPAKYETQTEQIEVSPASTKWVKKKADKNCLSANPEDCLVWCLVEVAPQYRTVTKSVRVGCDTGYTDNGDDCTLTTEIPAVYSTRSYKKLLTPATTRMTQVPAKYETRSYQKLATPPTSNVNEVPAVYTTRTITKVKSPATTETIAVPEVYETRSYQKLASPASVNVNEIAAKYGTRSYQKLTKDATTEQVTVPANYTTRSYKKLASPATSNTTDVAAVYTTRTYNVANSPSVEEVPCGKSSTLSGVNFASGSAELIGSSMSIIEGAASTLKADGECTARIVGHTDSDGGEAANQDLSRRRARTVYNALVNMGISASRLSYEGMGESSPIASNSNSSGKAANRRIEFVTYCGGGTGDCNQYTTRSYQKLASSATTTSSEVAAVYTTRSYKKLASDASSNSNDIAAKYETRSYQKLVTPASTRSTEVPAQYKTISKTNLVKKGGFTEWREVVCETDITSDLVRQVQSALKAKGYNPGPIDNSFGGATKKALVQFQKDNNLPVGALDFETLKALGVRQ